MPEPHPLVDDTTVDKTASQVRLSATYLMYMATSGVLASVALLSSSVPILIGSMIVAPLMPPLALVPFGLVTRRRAEAARGLGVALIGLLVAFGRRSRHQRPPRIEGGSSASSHCPEVPRYRLWPTDRRGAHE